LGAHCIVEFVMRLLGLNFSRCVQIILSRFFSLSKSNSSKCPNVKFQMSVTSGNTPLPPATPPGWGTRNFCKMIDGLLLKNFKNTWIIHIHRYVFNVHQSISQTYLGTTNIIFWLYYYYYYYYFKLLMAKVFKIILRINNIIDSMT